MSKIQPVRGTHDLLGNDILLYKHIRKVISEMADSYDYNEIETPIFENSELFKKPLGEFSDVVLKEMYSFNDRNQTSLTLRPEYTIPMIRASITNNLLNYLPVKLFGIGSMFRRERPQKGRYRQFNQINFEILGTNDMAADAELILLADDILKKIFLNKNNDDLLAELREKGITNKNILNAIKKVPAKFKNDIGLKYDRLKWRRRRGRLNPSLEILFDIPNDPTKLVRPDRWWTERSILTRSLIYKKKYALAYKVSSNHSMSEGSDYAEAEWLSGWVALTFLNDPNMALQHFKNFYNNVGYPISLSRGAYWIARTYKIINNNQKSEEWFKEASKYLNTYYGQLAFIEIYPGEPFSLDAQPKVDEKYEKKFKKNSLIKSLKLLNELNKTDYAKDIIKHLAALDIKQGSEILAGKLSVEIGRYDYAIQIAKKASYDKKFYNELNYPVIETPGIVNKKRMPKPELILAVIRQESEFDQDAHSYVGARGMMQLMTYTAKLVAKKAKLPYSKNRLKTDPIYNIKLGSYYLTELLEVYEGSYPFALAAYNAGPKRVKYWKKINGNPQKGKINYVDWIELVKFEETRNYIQRVLENVNVYRYMINGEPTKIYNFFEDKAHY